MDEFNGCDPYFKQWEWNCMFKHLALKPEFGGSKCFDQQVFDHIWMELHWKPNYRHMWE